MSLPKHIVKQIMDYRCISNIRLKLESYGIDPDEFIHKLKEDNAVIAGGFVLACMLGYQDTYNPDIDVYVEIDRKRNFGFTGAKNYCYQLINRDWNKCYSNSSYSCLEEVDCIYTYNLKYLSIDVISVNTEVYTFICNTFDLSFCKIAFDGYSVKYFGLDKTAEETLNYHQLICQWGVFQALSPRNQFYFNEYSQLYYTNLRLEGGTSKDIVNYYDHQSVFPKIPPIERKGLTEEDECKMRQVERYLLSLDRIQKYQSRGFKVLGF